MRSRARRQHHQPVEAERDAAGRRHRGERVEKILVQRVALAVDALLLRHRRLEAPALLGRIGQFAEAVGQFDAAGIKLETLGHLVAARLGARQRGQRQRVLI